MKINIVTTGHRPPQWVMVAYDDYAKRFGPNMPVTLHQINTPSRTKRSNVSQLVKQEGEKMLKIIPSQAYVIALDDQGIEQHTLNFAKQLQLLQHDYQHCYFLIGGPDGLSKACLKKANTVWALSKLTLPHNLARIVLIEQIYRTYTIMSKLPYHREGKVNE